MIYEILWYLEKSWASPSSFCRSKNTAKCFNVLQGHVILGEGLGITKCSEISWSNQYDSTTTTENIVTGSKINNTFFLQKDYEYIYIQICICIKNCCKHHERTWKFEWYLHTLIIISFYIIKICKIAILKSSINQKGKENEIIRREDIKF